MNECLIYLATNEIFLISVYPISSKYYLQYSITNNVD